MIILKILFYNGGRVTPEGKVQAGIRRKASELGFLCLKFSVIGIRGYPDLLIIRKGVVSFIEVKKPGKKLRPNQHMRQQQLQRFGIRCEWFDNVEDAEEFMRSLP